MICWIVLCAVIYIPIGVFLLIRADKKPIRNRSPLLVSIAHWSNFLECCLLLLSLFFYFSKSLKDKYFDTFYQIVVIIVHYSYFIAYMLRCYRIYFIFSCDTRIDDRDSFFRKNIHRAGQRWLLKVYLVLLWPVIIIASLRIFIAGADEYFPPSYYEGETNVTQTSEGLYLFILFLEELGFLFAVYKLRKVNDDFKMNTELTIVCVLWVLTGMFSMFPETWVWRIEVVIRNHIIMLISSFYPLYKTLGAESFDEVITLEMLQSLELILQSSVTLNAFEKAIANKKVKNYNGYDILQLWLKCENFRFRESDELREEILNSGKANKLGAKTPIHIQNETIRILNQHFFGIFKESAEYREILHDITRQQIYMSRILQTSIGGNTNDFLITSVH